MSFQIKRIYEEPNADDGKRILIDRLWPRGVKKEDAKLNAWMKELAPSNELRKWYHAGEGEERVKVFEKKYTEELKEKTEELLALKKLAREKTVTLLTATKDAEESYLRILKEHLK